MTAIERIRGSVVCVSISDAETSYQCSTGFYVDERGTVLTAEHVINPTEIDVTIIEVISETGRHFYTIKRNLPGIEATLLSPRNRIQSVPVQIATAYAQGEPVMLMGYPQNLIAESVLTVTAGIIGGRAISGPVTTGVPYIIMDLEAASGASGGPVFNVNGEVVGVLQASELFETISYATDITARSFQ